MSWRQGAWCALRAPGACAEPAAGPRRLVAPQFGPVAPSRVRPRPLAGVLAAQRNVGRPQQEAGRAWVECRGRALEWGRAGRGRAKALDAALPPSRPATYPARPASPFACA